MEEDIKRKSYAKLLEDEGEDTLRKLLAGIDLDAARDVKPPTKKGKKSSATSNGKGKAASHSKDVNNPSIEALDKIFDVIITVNPKGAVTKALIRDIRPADGEAEAKEEEVDVDAEEEEGEGEEEEDGVKKEKRIRKKARREWEEEVLCLLCQTAIY